MLESLILVTIVKTMEYNISFVVRKVEKIRNRYNQVRHLAQDATWEIKKKTQFNITNECQWVSSYPAGDHNAAMNGRESMRNIRHE